MLYQFAQFSFDSQTGALTTKDQKEIALRHKVAGLLHYLIEKKDNIVSKEELLENLWQHGDYRENSLTQSIRELRQALADDAKQPSYIKTYPQRGYQWICPLKESEQSRHNDSVEKPFAFAPRSLLTTTLFSIALVLALASGLGIYLFNNTPNAHHSVFDLNSQPERKESTRLLVLPFINATQDPTMAWLELGLSDMIAIDLQRSKAVAESESGKPPLTVTPPALANTLLLESELDWPSLPVHIRSLIREHDMDSALFASIRIHNEQQVFDFKLIHADGRTQQGSISYPSLPAAAEAISEQVLYLLRPEQKTRARQSTALADPIASQALAQGMQALQQGGPIMAEKYFQASLTIQANSPWTQAWLARSRYALGQWHAAESLFHDIPQSERENDISLDAFIAYWLAELAYRRGDDDYQIQLDNATAKAEQALDPKQMAQNYRQQARLAWNNRHWQEYESWREKADRLFKDSNDLALEADRLFYLGNPSNEGLEKNPNNDLSLNQEHLQKALNFYQQLNNQPKIAASQLAIAQNYALDSESREHALEQALSLYKELQQPYELAQALIYAGFYQMQQHQGEIALGYFQQAEEIAKQLVSKPLLNDVKFYTAFAILDQGLDQTAIGGHGRDSNKLRQAIELLEAFKQSQPQDYFLASSLVFLGWAHADLGQYAQALSALEQAKQLNKELSLTTSHAYSSYSIMRVHLAQKNYSAIINMESETISTRLQANYLARAYYENQQIPQAIDTLKQFKQAQPTLWQTEDDIRLTDYQNALNGIVTQLPEEAKAHLVYCESDWFH